MWAAEVCNLPRSEWLLHFCDDDQRSNSTCDSWKLPSANRHKLKWQTTNNRLSSLYTFELLRADCKRSKMVASQKHGKSKKWVGNHRTCFFWIELAFFYIYSKHLAKFWIIFEYFIFSRNSNFCLFSWKPQTRMNFDVPLFKA